MLAIVLGIILFIKAIRPNIAVVSIASLLKWPEDFRKFGCGADASEIGLVFRPIRLPSIPADIVYNVVTFVHRFIFN